MADKFSELWNRPLKSQPPNDGTFETVKEPPNVYVKEPLESTYQL